MLFDGRHHKLLVKTIAIVTSLAFLGFGVIAGGLAVSAGCAGTPAEQSVSLAQDELAAATQASTDADRRAKASPRDEGAKADAAAARVDLAEAWAALAVAQAGVKATDPEALASAQKGVQLAPGDLGIIMSLAGIAQEQGNPGAALPAFAAYTERNPRDAQAYAYWGQTAEQAGNVAQATLAYQRFLQLAPDDTLAPDVRTRLKDLAKR